MSEFVTKAKKIMKRTLVLVIVIGLLVVSFFYFGVYSRGERVGTLMKLSEKGIVFKTLEGQLNIEAFGAVRSQNFVSQTFEFSVENKRQDVIKDLKEAMSQGRRVNIKYIERYWNIPWRGDTKHFVREIDILPAN
jgi:hypothetical protein